MRERPDYSLTSPESDNIMTAASNGAVAPRRRRRTPAEAWAAFRARVVELGGTVVEPEWLGTQVPHRVCCAAGHDCTPTPDSVLSGRGLCRMCGYRNAGKDQSVRAESAFRARLVELGATLIEPGWLGGHTPHRVRCSAGHDCSPRPSTVIYGQGICRTCAGNDSAAAWAVFRSRVADLGGTVIESEWLGDGRPHRVRCSAGHESEPFPSNVKQGGGICRTCSGRDSAAAEARFRARLVELGATLIEPEWLGNHTPHRVRCSAGHETRPQPNSVQRGNGICRTCSGYDSATAEARFRARLVELGATMIEPEWLGDGRPHRVRCSAGHSCRPAPSNVKQGHGICRTCTGKSWDAFYVVTGPGMVKFGVTSGDPRPRLGVHRKTGLSTVVRLFTTLPEDVAPTVERVCLAALSDAGWEPVRGREYFPADALALVLDVADSHLAGYPAATL